MQQNTDKTPISFFIGDDSFFTRCKNTHSKPSFDTEVICFLNEVSKKLLNNSLAKNHPDVISFAFWIRKSSLMKYAKKYTLNDGAIRMGKGVAFHIAPSNVAVNYAYSLVSGLLAGNINIVKMPSKDFIQINIINNAIIEALKEYKNIENYVCLIRYGHDKTINDMLSSLADVRIVWGGDNTIKTIRESPLNPRSTEILFANRFSIAVIDSNTYLSTKNKEAIASNFYNDTFLTDQNACSSPKIIIWLGTSISDAKKVFWDSVHEIVNKKYNFQQKQSIDKYLQSCIVATKLDDVAVVPTEDNLIIRIQLKKIGPEIIECIGNSGFFLEYDAQKIEEIEKICDDSRCQTITYIGDSNMFDKISRVGMKGVDRIVPFGKSMDFDLIWDGYDLITNLSRIIVIRSI